MGDKITGLSSCLSACSNPSIMSAETRAKLLADAKAAWIAHPIGCEQYVTTVAYADCDEAVQQVTQLMEEKFFNLALAGHARSVARGWCTHRKRALLSDEGLDFTVKLFHTIGKVNQMSAYSFLQLFGDLPKFEDSQKKRLTAALVRMRDGLDPKEHESLFNQLNIMLKQ